MRIFTLQIIVVCIHVFPAISVACEPDFDRLLAQYRSYDLPEPPAGAQLIVYEMPGYVVSGNVSVPTSQIFGFLIENDGEDRAGVILFGTQEVSLDVGKVTRVDSDKADISNVASYDIFGMPSGLATAIQCKARGWDSLARKLWKQSIHKYDETAVQSIKLYQPTLGDKTADVVVATIGFNHYHSQLYNNDPDWRPAARKLLKIKTPTAGPFDEYFAETVKAALKPSNAVPGSIESLIDDLIESHFHFDSQSKRIIELGLDAVPALIEHVDDNRWTRGFRMLMLPSTPYQVGDYCESILRYLAAEPEESIAEGVKSKIEGCDGQISKAKARSWYKTVRKIGEEQYLLDNVFPKDDYPNLVIFWAIAAKYPQHVPRLYREFLSRALEDYDKWLAEGMAEAVAESKLSSDEKVALLVAAIEHREIAHRMKALSCLENLNYEKYLLYLRKAIEAMPKTASSDHWPFFARSVAESNDAQARRILLNSAMQGDSGLKMQLLHEVVEVASWAKGLKDRAKWREYAIEFAKRFLDDSSSCNSSLSKELGGLWDEDAFPKLEVRNLAAIQLGKILDVKARPQKDWTASEWSKFRGSVLSAHQDEHHR